MEHGDIPAVRGLFGVGETVDSTNGDLVHQLHYFRGWVSASEVVLNSGKGESGPEDLSVGSVLIGSK